MSADLNQYDLNHVTTAHDRMSKEEWERAYRLAWDTFYSPGHIATLLRRARASTISLGKILGTIVWFYGSVLYQGVHPLESGFLRLRVRRDRRPTFAIEPRWRFYPRYAAEMISKTWRFARLYYRYYGLRRQLEQDETAVAYTDIALSPPGDDESIDLELFTVTDSARASVARARRRAKRTVTTTE